LCCLQQEATHIVLLSFYTWKSRAYNPVLHWFSMYTSHLFLFYIFFRGWHTFFLRDWARQPKRSRRGKKNRKIKKTNKFFRRKMCLRCLWFFLPRYYWKGKRVRVSFLIRHKQMVYTYIHMRAQLITSNVHIQAESLWGKKGKVATKTWHDTWFSSGSLFLSLSWPCQTNKSPSLSEINFSKNHLFVFFSRGIFSQNVNWFIWILRLPGQRIGAIDNRRNSGALLI
jgi:hypothetical protein